MSAIPGYDPYQSAFHQAFEPDLYRVIDRLPLPSGGSVLDVPCGSGFYTRRLAERIGDGGRLAAVDVNAEYLARTRDRLADLPGAQVELSTADAYALPFEAGSFDLVWCAQSLISLDPAPAVREMYRVAKPSGRVAILEGDEFHHVLLPWPVELEAALPAALLAASRARYGDGGKLAPARRLRTILKQTGFTAVRRSTSTADRAAPFDPATRGFLSEHFAHLREFVRPHLTQTLQRLFDVATDPESERSIFHRPDAEFTVVNAVFVASACNSSVAGLSRPARGGR